MSENSVSRPGGPSFVYVALASTFCVCLIASNLFVPRLWQVGKLPLQLSGAVIIFPISYVINDLLTEVYGYRRAMRVIWLGFVLSAFVAVAAQIVAWLPAPLSPESQPVADAFNQLFGLVPRTTAASLLAFVIGSYLNALVMSWMKVATKGRGFGWRAIASSLAGEASDSLIFFPAAFWGVLSLPVAVQLAMSQIIAKVLYEIVALPLTSWVVRSVKRAERLDTIDDGVSYNPFRIKDI